jgi:hypothetical protein
MLPAKHHAITIFASYLAVIGGESVRGLRLTEMPMPDLDQIKQGEQAAGFP